MITEELSIKNVELTDMGFWDVNLHTMEVTLCGRGKQIFSIECECPVSLSQICKQIGQSQFKELLIKIKNSYTPGNRFRHEITVKNNRRIDNIRIRINGYVEFDRLNSPNRIIGAITELPQNEVPDLKKSDMLAMVSHELKSPLTTIKLYIQLVDKITGRRPDVSKYLGLAVREVDNMNLLMENFLNRTSIDSGSFKIFPKTFDLAEVIEEVVTHWESKTPNRFFRISKNEPLTVSADIVKMKHVLHNLLSNAVKYSQTSSAIDIMCVHKGNSVEICVKDEGEGIAKEDQEKLFGRFSRVGKPDSEIAGHGMGLFLVKQIIDAHNGSVCLNSKKGIGTEIYISIPAVEK